MGKHTKKGAGGKREGAGPKLKFGEKTRTWSIGSRIPESMKNTMDEWGKEVIKPMIESKLKTWEVPKEK